MSDYITESGKRLYFFNELDIDAQDRAGALLASDCWSDDWRDACNNLFFDRGITDNFDIDCDFFGRTDYVTFKGTFDVDELAYAARFDYTRPDILPEGLTFYAECTADSSRRVWDILGDAEQALRHTLTTDYGMERDDANACIGYIEQIVGDLLYLFLDEGIGLYNSYFDSTHVLHDDSLYYETGEYWGQCDYSAIADGPIYDNLAAII